MDRAALDSLDREGLIRIILMQFEAIERLTAEVVALRAENAELRTQNAELRAAPAQGMASARGARGGVESAKPFPNIFPAPVAVGTEISRRPPRRSPRAAFP